MGTLHEHLPIELATLAPPLIPNDAMLKPYLAGLPGHLLFWSVSLALSLADDAALLAMMFC